MISVLAATHNGFATAGRFLGALMRCAPPEGGWEVVVVDNASTDDTGKVLRSFQDTLPLRVLSHEVRGKNRALNHGLEHVGGEVVVLTDDDILPNADWLVAIRDRAARHPEVDLFGGPILPKWERTPPPWLEGAVPFGVVFGVTPNLPDGPVDPGRIWGGNMFLRRKVFDAGLRFDEGRGPGEGNYVMGGDTAFAVRAAAAGHSSWWCPEVRVQHIVRVGQIRRRWLLKRAYRHGKSVYVGEAKGDSAAARAESRLGFPRYMLRQAAEASARALCRDLLRDEAGALRQWWRFCHLCGYMVQARSARTGGR